MVNSNHSSSFLFDFDMMLFYGFSPFEVQNAFPPGKP